MRDFPTNSVDVVLCTLRDRELAVLLVRSEAARARGRWCLPWAPVIAKETPDRVAARVALRAAGARAGWLEQAGAFGGPIRHPGGAGLSVGYVGVTPARSAGAPAGGRWFAAGALPPVVPRHHAMIDAGLAQLRERLDRVPVAFRLLGDPFTLGELQAVYELLLGRRLHKASFRRALQAAFLVEPTDQWRSEGRGRPAQLFRYAPRRRRGGRGSVRFDSLGG
jgi:8-oxo-dGTP diphosphatase